MRKEVLSMKRKIVNVLTFAGIISTITALIYFFINSTQMLEDDDDVEYVDAEEFDEEKDE